MRNIATRIRGDVSHNDFLLLSQMQNISITKDTYHGGIDPESVFWVKENILSKEDLRQSMDEEQIADILGAMLLTPVPPSNVSILDEYYGYKQMDPSSRYQKLEEALSSVSPEKVAEQFSMSMTKSDVCFLNDRRRLSHRWFRQGPIEDRVIFRCCSFPCLNY